MSIYKLETGIAVPEKKTALAKYPFAEMQPGQSFFVPRNNNTSMSQHKQRLAASVSNARSKYPDRSFAVREIDNGVRIFRTA